MKKKVRSADRPSRGFECIEIDDTDRKELGYHGIDTCEKFLSEYLSGTLSGKFSDVFLDEVLDKCTEALAVDRQNKPKSAGDLPELFLGDKVLDDFFEDLFLCGSGITEFCGESGAGKSMLVTQVMFMLLFRSNVRLGVGRPFVFLQCGQQRFNVEQFNRLCERHNVEARVLTDRVLVKKVSSREDLEATLKKLRRMDIDFCGVAIDSFADLVRICGIDGFKQRSWFFYQISLLMKRISWERGIPFILTNQVTANIGSDRGADSYRPALSNSWSNSVNTRICLRKHRGSARLKIWCMFSSTIEIDKEVEAYFTSCCISSSDPGT